MEPKIHWDRIFSDRSSGDLTWYQPHLALSLHLIQRAGLDRSAWILDAGCGDSTLVDDLLDLGFTQLTLVDVSPAALNRVKLRLGARARQVTWIEADLRFLDLPAQSFDLWHDRAMFHFLVDPSDRENYISTVARALKPGGQLVIVTFAVDGPDHCSGLETLRYRPEDLAKTFGAGFELRESQVETHVTPHGGEQKFLYSLLRKKGGRE